MTKPAPKPNYTQAPNVFFDEMMPEIDTLSELKVVLAIIRQTFGWHKNEDELSLSRLEDLTGLSRPSVIVGTEAALNRGVIQRRAQGNSFVYSLVVKDVDQLSPLTSDSKDALPEVVKPLNTQKKEKENSKEQLASAPTHNPLPNSAERGEERNPLYVLYEDAFGLMSGRDLDRIHQWRDDYGPEIVAEALRETKRAGGNTPSYTVTIMRRLKHKQDKPAPGDAYLERLDISA
jgi:DNA replication protein DnaD